MNYHNLSQRIMLRLLRESQEEREERGRRRMDQGAGMAAIAWKMSDQSSAVIYDPQALLQHLEAIKQPGAPARNAILNHIMLGTITVGATSDPCNGAWEVTSSAVKNKGDGGVLYGIGYALSPGQLTSDRFSVSPPAQRGWAAMKRRQGGTPFDDASNPKTQDPDDDCRLHTQGDKCGSHIDLDSLNRSYEPEGWEESILQQLQQRHTATMAKLPPQLPEKITSLMVGLAGSFFRNHFNS